MSTLRHLPSLLIVLGGLTVGSALIWWGLTFWPTVSNDYLSMTEAGRCLVFDSSLCRLATSLCSARHAVLIAVYSPTVLWAGTATTFLGLTATEGGSATFRSGPPRSDLIGERVQLPIDGGSHLRQGPIVEDTGD